MTISNITEYGINILPKSNKKVFNFVVVLGLVLIALYLVFVASITFNIVARKSVENEIKREKTIIGMLELDYLNKTNNIDLAYATSHGYNAISSPIFSARDAILPRLSMR